MLIVSYVDLKVNLEQLGKGVINFTLDSRIYVKYAFMWIQLLPSPANASTARYLLQLGKLEQCEEVSCSRKHNYRGSKNRDQQQNASTKEVCKTGHEV